MATEPDGRIGQKVTGRKHFLQCEDHTSDSQSQLLVCSSQDSGSSKFHIVKQKVRGHLPGVLKWGVVLSKKKKIFISLKVLPGLTQLRF